MLSMMFLIELIFLFFPNDLQQSLLAILFLEIPLLGGTFTPLLTIFHLIIWGLMFFSSLIVYSIIREYTGGRTGLIEIAAIILVLAFSCWLIYDAWFALFFIGVSVVIVGYMYFSLIE